MTETELITRLTREIPRRKGDLREGVGDDCSVIRSGKRDILISCDSLVEDIHFRKKWGSWETWGHKAAAAALSDIAAMGGKPRFAWVHLGIPKKMRSTEVQKFYGGFSRLLKRHGTLIAGGNVSSSTKGFQATTTVWGEAPAGRAMLRKNAKPGEKVYVSGPLGLAPFKPAPQIPMGLRLLQKGCRCCIDVSDGLLQDLHHIATSSRVRIVLQAEKIPHKGGLKKAVTRGEDYILAFTGKLPESSRYFPVGEVREGKPGVQVLDKKGGLLSFSKRGFEHTIR